MADLPPESNGYTGVGPGRGPITPGPRWLKILGLIGIALVLLLVILHLIGHGLSHTPPSSVTEHSAQ